MRPQVRLADGMYQVWQDGAWRDADFHEQESLFVDEWPYGRVLRRDVQWENDEESYTAYEVERITGGGNGFGEGY